jgi:sugar O-acyltransferase (sialic acid O-acetyltransferase NeuD family)
MPKRIAIIGAGGMAREVRWLIETINRDAGVRGEPLPFEVAGYIVADPAHPGPYDCRDHVLGGDDWLDRHESELDALALGVADPRLRARLAAGASARAPHLEWPALVHPRADMDRDSTSIGQGVIICSNVLGTVNLVFEPFVLVNPMVTIGHEARLRRGCVINHSVSLSGGVTVGERVLVGVGARILQYLDIGDDATIGAGAVVTKSVAPGSTVVGIPAKPLDTERRPA